MSGNTFRWLVLVVVATVVGGGVYYTYKQTRPCAQPIHYAIGTVDSRFDISKSDLQDAAEKAAAVWSSAENKAVFTYDPNAKLQINLVYDTREEAAKLGRTIASAQADLDTSRSALDTLEARYSAEQASYEAARQSFNGRDRTALESMRLALNELGAELNQSVASFNTSVTAFNAQVATYNQTAGHTFEEGQYVRDKAGERINIFEFVGSNQLERVLAHEFGHALGLDHNADPKAIMFAKNESGSLTPTTADLTALHSLCGA